LEESKLAVFQLTSNPGINPEIPRMETLGVDHQLPRTVSQTPGYRTF